MSGYKKTQRLRFQGEMQYSAIFFYLDILHYEMVCVGLSRSDLATNFFWCTGKAPWSRIILSGLASLLRTVDTSARFWNRHGGGPPFLGLSAWTADSDNDNDGVANEKDVFPFDKHEWQDSDNDGLGDNADEFDSNKGPIIVALGDERTTIGEEIILNPEKAGYEIFQFFFSSWMSWNYNWKIIFFCK